ncbi:DNA polymerase-3 subunit chi [Neisseria sp. HSC-16F19]|nr:DNA polymerase III subunit chi [Neisseria sp. HSC-16F19]MCP2041797.1 DNA polymerase-3 subunit chi [Neisseria sp. HSC-16F19]
MPTTTFYTHVADVPVFACRLAHKAWSSGSRVLLWLEDEGELNRMDALLWTYEASAFVPHGIWQQGAAQPDTHSGVALACGDTPVAVAADTVVLNLADAYWCDAPQPPARVLEIIGNNLDELAAARNRFRAYREAGFTVEHHSREGKD